MASNERPIIGIVTWPETKREDASYFLPATYVKWIEGAGARVVPLLMSLPDDELIKLLHKINGVVLIGGTGTMRKGTAIRNYVDLIYKEVIAMNDAGKHVPIWGICLGFQCLTRIMSDDDDILSNSDSADVCLPMTLTEECSDEENGRRLFGPKCPASIIELATSADPPILYNRHNYCVTPEAFQSHPGLASNARIIATSADLQGKIFVSAFEALNYPIYGVQWHPEKAAYEFQPSGADHSWSAITVSSYQARFLVEEAMLNDNKFESPEDEAAALIYNHHPTFVSRTKPESIHTQVYLF